MTRYENATSPMKVIHTLIVITLLVSCSENPAPYTADVTRKKDDIIQTNFRRFDQDTYRNSNLNSEQSFDSLRNAYGSFFCDVVESDLRMGPCHAEKTIQEFIAFRNHPDIYSTHLEIDKVFTSEVIADIETEIESIVQRIHFFFPNKRIPEFIFYQAAWNNNIAITDSTIGIALDHYLGADNKAISSLTPDLFPMYKKKDMRPEMIIPDVAKSISSFECSPYYKQGNLMDELIIFGKILCLSKALSPNTNDSLLLSYSPVEMLWAQENEWNVWKALADNRTLFTSQRKDIDRWFSEGPFTSVRGIPQDSPPQLGVYIGWRMVSQFAENHPEISLPDLLRITDSNKFLETYTPQRK